MRRFEQLDFFRRIASAAVEAASFPVPRHGKLTASPTSSGSDAALEMKARQLLREVGAIKLIPLVRVEWNRRLRSAAGRAVFRHTMVSLNPRLHEHGHDEIDRTLRHELAHLVAQGRAGRRRISPHGPEWRKACRELGIEDEQRCHTLPFPTHKQARRYLYRCPGCKTEIPRVRRISRPVACLACCRRHNRGHYDQSFRLRLVHTADSNETA